MKALILAAGFGSRLRPLTNEVPKAMVQVNQRAIIDQQISNLHENGVADITVVVGYKAEMFKAYLIEAYPSVKIIENTQYNNTNNMYSAYLTRGEFYNCSFLLMNADVYFDSSILRELIKEEYNNSIVVEAGVYNDESMKVECTNNKIISISKGITEEKAFGVSIDVYKFSSEGSKTFFDMVVEFIEEKKDLNQWTEVALNNVLKEITFTPCPLKGRWIEIDNHDDLKNAEDIFNEL